MGVPWILLFFFRNHTDISRINFPHLVERCQLITIITFGETVIGLIETYPVTHHPILGGLFFFGIAMMFVAYISQTYLNINHNLETRATVLIYAHVFLIMSINLVTVGLEMVEDHHHIAYGLGLLIVGLFIYYFSLFSTSVYNRETYRMRCWQILPYILVIATGSLGMIIFREYLLNIS